MQYVVQFTLATLYHIHMSMACIGDPGADRASGPAAKLTGQHRGESLHLGRYDCLRPDLPALAESTRDEP